jgi:hypothetical protein
MNKFDSDNFATSEPEDIDKTTLVSWKRPDLSDLYDPTLHTLQYSFISLESSADFTIDATNTDGVFTVSTTPTTAGKGHYKWTAYITQTSSGNKIVVDEGFANIAPGTGQEHRSHNLIVLQAIRATIEKTATKEQQSYSIEGRALSRRTIEELTTLEQLYTRKWEAEKARLDRKNGKKAKSSLIRVRF